jgi:hypothetical protein
MEIRPLARTHRGTPVKSEKTRRGYQSFPVYTSAFVFFPSIWKRHEILRSTKDQGASCFSLAARLNSIVQANHRWVKLGCSLLTTLTASPDGVRYLSTEDPFLAQIMKSFAQLDPVGIFLASLRLPLIVIPQSNAVPDVDPVFSKRRVSGHLTYGYLVMLGTLSKTKEGIEYVRPFSHHLRCLRNA